MIKERIIAIEELRRAPRRYLMDRGVPYYIKIDSHHQAVILEQKEYEELRSLAQYRSLVENVLFLVQNKSLQFLREEPDLYENY